MVSMAALSTAVASHALRLFPSALAAAVAARWVSGLIRNGILPENGLSGACPCSAHIHR